MIAQLKQRIGSRGFAALQIVLAVLAYLAFCTILKSSVIPGAILALRSLLYMIPFAAVGVLVILAIRLKWISRRLGTPILAVLFALCVGIVLILWADCDPFMAYGALITGAFGSVNGISETLVITTPLILTGLAIAIAYRCGLFNIGAEGQFIVGQMGAAWAGFALKGLPLLIHLPLTLLAGILAGALWAAIPGYLKARRGVHEVINSIMMNYIALYLTHYLVIGPLMAPGFLPVTPTIAETAKLPRLLAWLSPSYRLNAGLFVALLAAVLIYWLLWKTTTGYEIRAVGLNPNAAKYGGISVSKNIILAMMISGGLAGMAGAVHVMGIQYKFTDIFVFTGFGLDGIPVALLGNNHPFGVILGALLFGSLSLGAQQMQLVANVPKQIITVVQATIIFFVAAEQLASRIIDWKRKRAAASSTTTKEVAKA